MSKLIDIHNAVYRYQSHMPEMPPVTAVSDMTVAIAQGAFWVVLGRNGSGKSTLSRLMNALLLPAEGTVFVDGLSTSEEGNLWRIRRTVGVVFQNPDNQIVATTVEEDVAFGPENLGVPQPEIRKRVDTSLATVNMTEYLTHSPHMLSGGQKQRIAIAGILAMQPKCIVLDEATSMLDPEGRAEVLQAIRTLHTDHGMTVVLITHHMEEAVEADAVMVMQAGGALVSGTPEEVFQQADLLREAGLDVPQITAMGEALQKAGYHRGRLPVTGRQATELLEQVYDGLAAVDGATPGLPRPSADEGLLGVFDSHAQHQERDVLISVRDLRHVYMSGTLYERIAVDGVSLDIHKGEILGIIGHTGSGKSTFVQHLNGLLKGTSGTIEVEGTLLEPKTLKTLRRKVGLIFQYPEHQLFEETVRKDIAFGLSQLGMSAEETARRVEKAADLLSIAPELLDKSPFELSGGQKRRVAIAGVLAMEPSILILDEPTAGLDPRGSREVFRLLRELNRKEGTTIVLISHNMEDMAAFADRVAVMRKGRVALLGTPREVFSRESALKDMHLDVPAVTRLFLALARSRRVTLPTVLTVDEGIRLLRQLSERKVEA